MPFFLCVIFVIFCCLQLICSFFAFLQLFYFCCFFAAFCYFLYFLLFLYMYFCICSMLFNKCSILLFSRVLPLLFSPGLPCLMCYKTVIGTTKCLIVQRILCRPMDNIGCLNTITKCTFQGLS